MGSVNELRKSIADVSLLDNGGRDKNLIDYQRDVLNTVDWFIEMSSLDTPAQRRRRRKLVDEINQRHGIAIE